MLWHKELNPILEGRILAREQGCFGCHRPLGGPEIPNPGSRWGSVPKLAAGNAMMYASTAEEIEEVIRFGAPRAWLDDPAAAARLEDQPVRMPAYQDRLPEGELAKLVAFAVAVERVDPPTDETAARGLDLARKHGCLACHGVEGSGGLPNPASLGGFTPGFLGGNFADMVHDRAEFDEWVLEGTSHRLEANPLIRWFWGRQDISMPPYRGRIEADEIGAIWAWIETARSATIH